MKKYGFMILAAAIALTQFGCAGGEWAKWIVGGATVFGQVTTGLDALSVLHGFAQAA
jgi:hypothetical protein